MYASLAVSAAYMEGAWSYTQRDHHMPCAAVQSYGGLISGLCSLPGPSVFVWGRLVAQWEFNISQPRLLPGGPACYCSCDACVTVYH